MTNYVELFRDFCGTVNSIYGDDIDDIVVKRTINAYSFTKAIIYRHKDELFSSDVEDHVIVNYFKAMLNNVMADIFETGMFLDTKDFMNKVLTGRCGADNIEPEELQRFDNNYWGDMASELAMSNDDLLSEVDNLMP